MVQKKVLKREREREREREKRREEGRYHRNLQLQGGLGFLVGRAIHILHDEVVEGVGEVRIGHQQIRHVVEIKRPTTIQQDVFLSVRV
jgi:hypothetical protein